MFVARAGVLALVGPFALSVGQTRLVGGQGRVLKESKIGIYIIGQDKKHNLR